MLNVPLTAAIVIFETTGHSTLILPFLLSSLLGNFVGSNLSVTLARKKKPVFDLNKAQAVARAMLAKDK